MIITKRYVAIMLVRTDLFIHHYRLVLIHYLF